MNSVLIPHFQTKEGVDPFNVTDVLRHDIKIIMRFSLLIPSNGAAKHTRTPTDNKARTLTQGTHRAHTHTHTHTDREREREKERERERRGRRERERREINER